MSVDVRFSLDDALKIFTAEAQRHVDSLNGTVDDLREKLTEAMSFKAADIVSVTDADAVVVVDFECSKNSMPIRRIGLSFEGGWGNPPVELAKGLDFGSYRAVILVSKRK